MNNFEEFRKHAPSAYHTVAAGELLLDEYGFKRLEASETWSLNPGGKYYIELFDTTLLAFGIGNKPGRLKIAAAHTDFPCFRIKPSAGMNSNGYGRLNVEGYGGAILNSWYDRPVGIAGKVYVRGDDIYEPEEYLFDSGRAVGIIPNLAIHMNRDVNRGSETLVGRDMLPLVYNGDDSSFFENYLSRQLGVAADDILDYELFVYNFEEGMCVGINDEFYSAPRLDNLTSVYACLDAIINQKNEEGVHLVALFDNEEIGSATKQGAGSQILGLMLEKIYSSLGMDRTELINAYMDGMMLSIDVAHAIHPNRPDKSDSINTVVLNKGVVLKTSGAYAYDGKSISVVKELCNNNDIPYQIFTKQSDSRGGSTLGAISDTMVPITTLDIGVPLLAMHSARETIGTKDMEALQKMIYCFFDN